MSQRVIVREREQERKREIDSPRIIIHHMASFPFSGLSFSSSHPIIKSGQLCPVSSSTSSRTG